MTILIDTQANNNFNLVVVSYSDTSSAPAYWQVEKDGNVVFESVLQSNEFIDHDVFNNTSYQYVCKSYDNSDNVIDQVSINFMPNFIEWALKDLDDDDIDNMVLLFMDGDQSLRVNNREYQAKFNPLGRKYPMVIKDAQVKSDNIPLILQFLTFDEYEKFDTLRQRQKALRLSGPRAQYNWDGVFDSELDRTIINDVDGYSVVRIDFIETGNE